MGYCTNCGAELPDNAEVCYQCGAHLEDKSEDKAYVNVVHCPNCGAALEYTGELERMRCQYCSTDILINDKASELNRVYRAKSEAKLRDLQMDMDYDLHKSKMEIKSFFLENPLFCIIAFFLMIYTVKIFLQERLGFGDIILDAIILNAMWKVTNKKKEK